MNDIILTTGETKCVQVFMKEGFSVPVSINGLSLVISGLVGKGVGMEYSSLELSYIWDGAGIPWDDNVWDVQWEDEPVGYVANYIFERDDSVSCAISTELLIGGVDGNTNEDIVIQFDFIPIDGQCSGICLTLLDSDPGV